MDDKTKSIVAHLTLIGWIIALVMNQSDKGAEYFLLPPSKSWTIWLVAIRRLVIGMFTLSIISTIVIVAF